jgi:ribonuclease E
MSKEIYISSTPHETRLAIVEGDQLAEIYYERENEYTLAGSIYNGRVTRVLPGMQSSFVDIGLERDAFLYITDFMEEAGDSAEFDNAAGGAKDSRSKDAGAKDSSGQEKPSARSERKSGRNRRGGRRDDRAPRDEKQAVDGDTAQPVDSGWQGYDGELDSVSAAAEGTEAPAVERNAADQSAAGRNEAGEAGSGRRWRGRRGRRRGRPGEAAVPQAEGSEGALENASGEGQEFSEGQEFGEGRDSAAAEGFIPVNAGFTSMNDGLAMDDGYAAPDFAAADFSDADDADLPEESRGGPREVRDVAANDDGLGAWGEGRSRRESRDRSRGQEPDSIGESASAERGFSEDRGSRRRGNRDEYTPAEPSAPAANFLPGESLARYNRTVEPDTAAPASAPARPSNEFVVSDWDGGLVLPGETLRPRAGAGVSAPRREQRFDRGSARGDRHASSSDRGSSRGDRGASRSDRGTHARAANDGVSGTASNSTAASSPAPSSTAAGSTATEGRPRRREREGRERDGRDREGRDRNRTQPMQPAPSTAEAAPRMKTFAAEPAAPQHVAEFVGSAAITAPGDREREHETANLTAARQDAEAHAADPRDESEKHAQGFAARLSSMASHLISAVTGVAREDRSAETKPAEPVQPHAAPAVAAEYEPADEASASLRGGDSNRRAYRQSVAAEEIAAAPQQTVLHASEDSAFGDAAPSEFTAIEPTGEMISEVRGHGENVKTPAAAPIEAQAAVQGVTLAAAEANATMLSSGDTEAGTSANTESAPQHFEPGHGQLEEEELMDEEDLDDDRVIDLQAASAEYAAHDGQHEEDALEEGAPDLGVMLREMTIDEVTQADEGNDFDEDEYDDEDIDEEEMQRGEDEADDAEDSEIDESEDALAADDSGEADDRTEGTGEGEGDAAPAAQPRREGGRRREGRARRGGTRDSGTREGGTREGQQREKRSGSSNGAGSGRMSRSQAQTSNLPAISDLLKPGQELLVQIAKEPIAKKGARITSHIALPGRFLVFMPTVSHMGVSRKIDSDAERRRLKEILLSEKGEASGGFIVRTAAAGASEEELRSDLRFLLNLWQDIKNRSEGSKSPALIYHDLNLVERVLRDQVTDQFSAIWVDTEAEYERVLRFLQRFQPALIRRVKLYTKEVPLYEHFGITEEINKALRSKVWLKSGGSIVINQTEALVAIDINTGKYVGKTARLEDTIVKTNLDAIPEIVRQIRLRDLGGIIIIDFIDMDERKNRAKVMQALEDELRSDRAPSKVLSFNDFGLVAITRKRVKQSLERTLSTTCGVCQGTGMVKSPITVANDIYIEMRKMAKHLDRGDVMLRVNPEVVKQLKAPGTKWLQEMEEIVGKTILLKSDPSLHPEQFDIH